MSNLLGAKAPQSAPDRATDPFLADSARETFRSSHSAWTPRSRSRDPRLLLTAFSLFVVVGRFVGVGIGPARRRVRSGRSGLALSGRGRAVPLQGAGVRGGARRATRRAWRWRFCREFVRLNWLGHGEEELSRGVARINCTPRSLRQ